MLKINDVYLNYGPIQALSGVSLECVKGKITALIGANGAGKSSLMKAISGVAAVSSGEVILDGKNITSMPAHERAKIGIAHAMEGRRIFHQQTVEENLRTAWIFRKPSGNYEQAKQEVYDNFNILYEKRNLKAGTLSGGQQQMLIISMATLHKPKLVLLDEPSLGLAPIIVTQIFDFIRHYCDSGQGSILLSEQMATLALKIADFGYVLNHGKVVLEGTRDELKQNQNMTTAYLGGNSGN